MARGWRILDATSFEGTVGGERGRLTLTNRDGFTQKVPAEESAVLLIGDKAKITAAALYYLSKHDVVLLATDWRGIPLSGLYPWSNHGRVAARHLAQAALTLPRKKNAWMQLVRAKIIGQAATLDAVDRTAAKYLAKLAREVRSGDPANAEGTAARVYWRHLFPEADRFTRDQDGNDALNSLLNYGYTVLRGYGVRAVLSAGLSPPLGLFHRGRGNYFNLVDDLIEPFRPAIDDTVVRLGPGANLADRDVRATLVSAASQAFTSEGHRIPTVLEDLAQSVGRYVEGEVDRLEVIAWIGSEQVGVMVTPDQTGGLADDGADPPW